MKNPTPVISLTNIEKTYRIYSRPQDRLIQAIVDKTAQVFGRRLSFKRYREHTALKDVSFNVMPGEAVGIVGRNGAGKSTLLQILAGRLQPTAGTIQRTGAVTAVLELGTGFNPDFSGLENVQHSAQVLGLSRKETFERMQEIVDFADIGDFIHEPVRTYSTGMTMRLAFAIQTALRPTTLIIDEALSVGDARFQEKCFRKLAELRTHGVSILLVSHDINSVTTFCDRALLLENGQVVITGQPKIVAEAYLKTLYGSQVGPKEGSSSLRTEGLGQAQGVSAQTTLRSLSAPDAIVGRFGSGKVTIIHVEICNRDNSPAGVLYSGRDYRIRQKILVNEDIRYLSTGFIIKTTRSVDIFGVSNRSLGQPTGIIALAGDTLDIYIDIQLWLAAGDYILLVANAGADDVQYDCIPDALSFTVFGTPELFTTSLVNLNPRLSISGTRDSS
jgi:lipopolysaccharide transport system ATP-binding protein